MLLCMKWWCFFMLLCMKWRCFCMLWCSAMDLKEAEQSRYKWIQNAATSFWVRVTSPPHPHPPTHPHVDLNCYHPFTFVCWTDGWVGKSLVKWVSLWSFSQLVLHVCPNSNTSTAELIAFALSHTSDLTAGTISFKTTAMLFSFRKNSRHFSQCLNYATLFFTPINLYNESVCVVYSHSYFYEMVKLLLNCADVYIICYISVKITAVFILMYI